MPVNVLKLQKMYENDTGFYDNSYYNHADYLHKRLHEAAGKTIDSGFRQQLENYSEHLQALIYDPHMDEFVRATAELENFHKFLKASGKDGRNNYQNLMDLLDEKDQIYLNDSLQTVDYCLDVGMDLKALNGGKEPKLPEITTLERHGKVELRPSAKEAQERRQREAQERKEEQKRQEAKEEPEVKEEAEAEPEQEAKEEAEAEQEQEAKEEAEAEQEQEAKEEAEPEPEQEVKEEAEPEPEQEVKEEAKEEPEAKEEAEAEPEVKKEAEAGPEKIQEEPKQQGPVQQGPVEVSEKVRDLCGKAFLRLHSDQIYITDPKHRELFQNFQETLNKIWQDKEETKDPNWKGWQDLKDGLGKDDNYAQILGGAGLKFPDRPRVAASLRPEAHEALMEVNKELNLGVDPEKMKEGYAQSAKVFEKNAKVRKEELARIEAEEEAKKVRVTPEQRKALTALKNIIINTRKQYRGHLGGNYDMLYADNDLTRQLGEVASELEYAEKDGVIEPGKLKDTAAFFNAQGKPYENRNAVGFLCAYGMMDRETVAGPLKAVSDAFGLGIDVDGLTTGRKQEKPKREKEEPKQEKPKREEVKQKTEGDFEIEGQAGENVIADAKDPTFSTALQAIEYHQANFDQTIDSQTFLEHASQIMGYRIEANSIRGKKSSLNVVVDDEEARKTADSLYRNKTFKKFVDSICDDKNPGMKRKAIKAMTKGHGGAFEDMFKEYVKTLPPGELENDPALERYMPTMQERIEVLQGHAKSKDENVRAAAAAEIMTLRDMAKVEWGKKARLKAAIPTDPSAMKLSKTVRWLCEGDTKNILASEAVQDLMTKGHGGKMAEEVRRQDASLDLEYVHQNSIKGQCVDCASEAARLMEQEPVPEMEAKQLISKYCILVEAGGKDMENQHRDAPWSSLDAMQNEKTANQVLNRSLGDKYVKNHFKDDLNNILTEIAANNPGKFMGRMKAMEAEHSKPEMKREASGKENAPELSG